MKNTIKEKESAIIPIMKQEKTYHQVNINDSKALAMQIKQILADRVNMICDPEIIVDRKDKLIVQIDNYTVEVDKLDIDYKVSEKMELHLNVFPNDYSIKEEMLLPIEFVDTQAPVLVLKTSFVELYEDENFDPQSYVEKIYDNYDTELTFMVNDENIRNNDKLQVGEHELIYTCSDKAHNQTRVVLNVHVKERVKEEKIRNDLPVSSQLDEQVSPLLGKPYVWGGKGPDVFDCSGIIMYLYKLNGIKLAWHDIQYGTGENISLETSLWQMGDVLSYANQSGEIIHHALYLGNQKVLHAITSGVSVLDVNTPLIASDGLQQQLVRVMRYTNKFVNEK